MQSHNWNWHHFWSLHQWCHACNHFKVTISPIIPAVSSLWAIMPSSLLQVCIHPQSRQWTCKVLIRSSLRSHAKHRYTGHECLRDVHVLKSDTAGFAFAAKFNRYTVPKLFRTTRGARHMFSLSIRRHSFIQFSTDPMPFFLSMTLTVMKRNYKIIPAQLWCKNAAGLSTAHYAGLNAAIKLS